MSKKIQIPLKENLKAAAQDIYTSIKLGQRYKKVLPGIVQEQINLSELSQEEREACPFYQLYGKINYLSPLNRIADGYNDARDFFETENKNRSFKKSFDIYVVRPSNTTIRVVDLDTDTSTETSDPEVIKTKTQFIRLFEVITKVTDTKIMPSAFEKNIYGEQIYNFYVNKVIDMSEDWNLFGHPSDEIYLYLRYKPSAGEGMEFTNLVENDTLDVSLTNGTLSQETLVYGDYVQYFKNNFKETVITEQEYRVKSRPVGGGQLEFIYKPFIPLRVFSYGEEINTAPKDTDDPTLPPWVKENGNRYYWRDKIPMGIIEENGLGVDHAYMNNLHYVHKNINLIMKADTNHSFTKTFFNKLLPGNFISDGYKKEDNDSVLPNC